MTTTWEEFDDEEGAIWDHQIASSISLFDPDSDNLTINMSDSDDEIVCLGPPDRQLQSSTITSDEQKKPELFKKATNPMVNESVNSHDNMDDSDDEVIFLGPGPSKSNIPSTDDQQKKNDDLPKVEEENLADGSNEVTLDEIISLIINSNPCPERDELMKQTLIAFNGGDIDEEVLDEDLQNVNANNGRLVVASDLGFLNLILTTYPYFAF